MRRLDQRALELEVDRREKNRLLESFREGIPFPGIEFLVPYFCPALVPVFSYLPRRHAGLARRRRSRGGGSRAVRPSWPGSAIKHAKEEHRLVAPVETLYLNEHEWRAALQAVFASPRRSAEHHGRLGARPGIDTHGRILFDQRLAPGNRAARQGRFPRAVGRPAQELGKQRRWFSSRRPRAMRRV